MGCGAPASGKALCIAPPVAFSRYKDAPSLAACPTFSFPSHAAHSSRSCGDLRPPFICRPSLIVDCCVVASHEASAFATSCYHWPSISQSVVPRPSWTLSNPVKAFERAAESCSLSCSPSFTHTYTHTHTIRSPSLQSRLPLNPVGDGLSLRRAKGLMALNLAALDPRTLTFRRQPLFYHRSADLGVCCDIGRGPLAGADRRGEAIAG